MCEFPSIDDWVTLVRNDLSFLNINHSDEYFSMTSKVDMKQIVQEAIQIKRDEFLINLQNSHSKSSKLSICENIKEYLVTKRLSTHLKKFLFSLRNNMSINKVNYKNKHSNLVCRLCELENSEESLTHFISCDFLLQNVPEVSSITPDDIYGDIDQQVRATHIWKKVFQYLEKTETNQAHG